MVNPNSRLSSLLNATDLFSKSEVSAALRGYSESSRSLAETISSLGLAEEKRFLKVLADAMDLPFLRFEDFDKDEELLARLPTKAIFQYDVIPVGCENGVLRIATCSPFKHGMVDALGLASGMRVKLALSPSQDIDQAIKSFYGVGAETVDAMLQDGRIQVESDAGLLKEDLSKLDQEASVVKFVNQIIWEAYQERATDIHLEPMEKNLRVRYRIDGVLHEAPLPAQLKRFQSSILSRIKVMANMDIAEKRLPQDGRISLTIQGEDLDVRVSTMPTVYGESVSLRLLLRSGAMFGMEELGLDGENQKLLSRLIHKPHGILLVTGPTGSGKSTSLYAWLHTINSIDKRIMTVEDPIEYEMTGINQTQMRPDIGLTFATGLRHILRQDPDVIMVGEIRDRETAEIAIRAALTGHLVFSTLHTNDSAGAVTRLLDMGIEPFLVASSVEAIVAQRLVRRVCGECREVWNGDRELLAREGFPVELLDQNDIYAESGCDACHQTGYTGRGGIFEVLPITDQLRSLIIDRASSSDIRNLAIKQGMRLLRRDGWEKVLQGKTTVSEVLRVSEEAESLR